MPTWGQTLKELEELQGGEPIPPSPQDLLRRKYLAALKERTGRDAILYYSAWLDPAAATLPPGAISVTLTDQAGLMESCAREKTDGLDLILHSPGGDPDAAEALIAYLRTQYDHIRAVVPLAAMSAATMMALSADEILMGAQSQLGPIDPQLSITMPEGQRQASAQAIRDQFDLAVEQCEDPTKLPAWTPILRTFAPGLLAACDHATERAQAIVEKALSAHMFQGDGDADKKAAEAAAWFADARAFLSHGHPVRRDAARDHGIVVHDLEDDDDLQDAVLSVHHAAMHTLTQTPVVKLVENDAGDAWLLTSQTQVVVPQPPQGEQGGKKKKKPPPPPRKRGKRR